MYDTKTIKEMLNGDEYSFLRENEHLKGNICLLALGGSYAYGTNTETSDVDIRGCALNRERDLIGLSSFDEYVNEETDTTIYSFNKLISLLLNCNPNTIEILGCKPEHYFNVTKQGILLLLNKKLFLSKRAGYAFGGYARQQLARMENALARDAYSQPEREEHIFKSMNNMVISCNRRYAKNGEINLFLDKSEREDMEIETFANINLEHIPVRNFHSILNELKQVAEQYNGLHGRNKKKDDAHLNKHAMHLIRLYLMCIDIFEKEDIITYRVADRDMLLDIRNGKYRNVDGMFNSAYYDMLHEYEKRYEYAWKNTSLPEKPDFKKVEDLVMEVNRTSIQTTSNQ